MSQEPKTMNYQNFQNIRKESINKIIKSQLKINELAQMAEIFENKDQVLDILSEVNHKLDLVKRTLEYNKNLWEVALKK